MRPEVQTGGVRLAREEVEVLLAHELRVVVERVAGVRRVEGEFRFRGESVRANLYKEARESVGRAGGTAVRHGEVAGESPPGDVEAAVRIPADDPRTVARAAAEVREIDERRSRRINLRQVAVAAGRGDVVGRAAAEGRLECARRDGEVGREGAPGEVDVPRLVEFHVEGVVVGRAAEVGRIDEARLARRGRRVELHEHEVCAPPERPLHRPRADGDAVAQGAPIRRPAVAVVPVLGRAQEVDLPRAVHLDVPRPHLKAGDEG